MMKFRLICSSCGMTARVEVDQEHLPLWISPVAAALGGGMRLAGMKYRNGKIGKSVVSVRCANCVIKIEGPALYLEADFTHSEVVPGTCADDEEEYDEEEV